MLTLKSRIIPLADLYGFQINLLLFLHAGLVLIALFGFSRLLKDNDPALKNIVSLSLACLISYRARAFRASTYPIGVLRCPPY